MKLAILFWIYKDVGLCVERARQLRRLNPGLSIYALFGGDIEAGPEFSERLSPFVDDFFVFPETALSSWKWKYGDQIISRWYRDRGHEFEWDTIFVAQWDLLLLSPVTTLCANLQKDQLLLPGLRPLREVADFWWWVRCGSEDRAEFDAFCGLLSRTHGMPADPYCCNFPAGALPRSFLEKYLDIPEPQVGFLEYKLPMYAQVWNFGFCTDHGFNINWPDRYGVNAVRRYLKTFHAEKRPIKTLALLLNALAPRGARAFHPYTRPAPFLLKLIPRRERA